MPSQPSTSAATHALYCWPPAIINLAKDTFSSVYCPLLAVAFGHEQLYPGITTDATVYSGGFTGDFTMRALVADVRAHLQTQHPTVTWGAISNANNYVQPNVQQHLLRSTFGFQIAAIVNHWRKHFGVVSLLDQRKKAAADAAAATPRYGTRSRARLQTAATNPPPAAEDDCIIALVAHAMNQPLLFPDLPLPIQVHGTTLTIEDVVTRVRMALHNNYPDQQFDDVYHLLSRDMVPLLLGENDELTALVLQAAHSAFRFMTST